MDAFYERLDGDRFRSTASTRGPWSRDHQHAGPPSALLGSQLRSALGDGRLTRITFEILRPVPVADLTVAVEVVRPGRKVTLGQAVLSDDEGPVMLARAWRLREAEVGLPADDPVEDERMAPPTAGSPAAYFPIDWDGGYDRAMDVRFLRSGFLEPGDGAAWLRSRIDIVAGEPITPLQRLLVAADTGNGISARMSPREWLFVNTDLTVHVRDLPADEWVGLDARTRFGPGGIGLATATIHGSQGPIGTAIQSLLVEPQAR